MNHPELAVIYVHPEEILLNKNAAMAPIRVGEPELRVWFLKRGA